MILNWPKHHLKWCPKDTDVHNRNGDEVGKATGTYRRCSMHGCTGLRIGVRWPDGRLTWPCSKGVVPIRIGVQIL